MFQLAAEDDMRSREYKIDVSDLRRSLRSASTDYVNVISVIRDICDKASIKRRSDEDQESGEDEDDEEGEGEDEDENEDEDGFEDDVNSEDEEAESEKWNCDSDPRDEDEQDAVVLSDWEGIPDLVL